MVNLFSSSPFKTKKLGEILGKEILKTKKTKRALILGLEGDLGGGKTTFLQGFAKGLGIKEKILSPTFVIIKRFKIKDSPKQSHFQRDATGQVRFKNFYHIDCYRLQKPKEILFLGFKEIVSNPKNIVVIEWADRLRKTLPQNTLILKFEFVDQRRRKIKIRIKN